MGKGKEKGSKASSSASSGAKAASSGSKSSDSGKSFVSGSVCSGCDKRWDCTMNEFIQHVNVDCPKVKSKTNEGKK